MSWHGRNGRPDPYAKPTRVGKTYGCWTVVDVKLPTDAHYGLRVRARCTCGAERIWVLAQLRNSTKRGLTGRCRDCADNLRPGNGGVL